MSEKDRIEQLIKTLGLTARQFAAEIRVQPGTISNMMAMVQKVERHLMDLKRKLEKN